jgi:hypothetical protein
MSQRLVINYSFDDETSQSNAKRVFNADQILNVAFLPDGMDDNTVIITMSTGGRYSLSCNGSTTVPLEVVDIINAALTSNPAGSVVQASLGTKVFTVSNTISAAP